MVALILYVAGVVRGIGRGIRSFHPVRNGRPRRLTGAGSSVQSVPSVGRVRWGGREGFRVFRGGWAGLWGGFVPFVFLLLYPVLTLAQPDLQIAGRIAPPVPGESA